MDFCFKQPKLQIIDLINSNVSKEEVREFLVSNLHLNLYKRYIDKNVLEYNKEDLDLINNEISKKFDEFEKEKEENVDNEPILLEISKKKCEFYAQIFDIENFEKLANEIIEKDNSSTLQLNILMCKIRIALILENRASLIQNIEQAKFVFENSSDWECKNKLKAYFGLFYLIKAEFEKAAEYFCDSIASFNAHELFSFEKLSLYFVFSSLISFDRNKLKKYVINNSEVRKSKEFIELPECLFNCEYSQLFRKLIKFIDYCENDCFLSPFKEHFCKEMKIKGYYQLLLCYQSLHLDKMAQYFNVETDHIEEDLRNFIVEKKLNCTIDRIDGVVRMGMNGKAEDLETLMKTGEKVLRDIKKSIN